MKKYFQILAFSILIIIANIITNKKITAQSTVPKIELISCLGGERFIPTNTVSIRWKCSQFIGVVDLSLWDRKTKQTRVIASRIPSNIGVYIWKVPDDYTGRDYILTIKASDNSTLSSKSKGYFSVLSKTELNTGFANQMSTSVTEDEEFNNPSMICRETVCKIKTFRIGRIYPQPIMNGTISLDAESTENVNDVKAELYSITGERISTLWKGNLNKGSSSLSFTITDLANGTYILYLKNHQGEVVDYNRLVVAEGQK